MFSMYVFCYLACNYRNIYAKQTFSSGGTFIAVNSFDDLLVHLTRLTQS